MDELSTAELYSKSMVVRSADLIQATGCVSRPLEEQIVHTQKHFVLRVLHGANTYTAL